MAQTPNLVQSTKLILRYGKVLRLIFRQLVNNLNPDLLVAIIKDWSKVNPIISYSHFLPFHSLFSFFSLISQVICVSSYHCSLDTLRASCQHYT